MNAQITVVTAYTVTESTRLSWRIHTTSYTSPHAPETRKSAHATGRDTRGLEITAGHYSRTSRGTLPRDALRALRRTERVSRGGIEPPTRSLKGCCSTN